MRGGQPEREAIARVVGRHALLWLVAANAVGVWMAALLVWPGLGRAFPSLSYGRWMPLHLDWQLYGWCALPLVAILWSWCADPGHPGALGHARLTIGLWSLALSLGGLSWLAGLSSGKPFLEWSGWARPLLPAAMAALWSFLAAHVWWARRAQGGGGLWARGAIIVALAGVPTVLYWSMGREVYPSVNPDSGGATGARLLASTLGIVLIYGLLGEVLRCVRARVRWVYWGYLAVSWIVFLRIEVGNASNHEVSQWLGLGTLVGWIPWVAACFDPSRMKATARPWWVAAFVWWSLLVVSGFVSFVPGILERLKFTNAMVGHAHVAMAGLVSSVGMAILVELGAVRAKSGFWLWQGATAVGSVALTAYGWSEAANPANLYLSGPASQVAYSLRMIAGVVLLAVSLGWLRSELRLERGRSQG